MRRIGIEKINIYGSSLILDQRKLAEARGMDPQKVVADFLIDTRSLNPLYEDAVTMGANAAEPMLTGEDRTSIGMLVVGTESSVDFGKPISTNIHGALGLPTNVRNFETKHACYSGVAALDTALNWVASGQQPWTQGPGRLLGLLPHAPEHQGGVRPRRRCRSSHRERFPARRGVRAVQAGNLDGGRLRHFPAQRAPRGGEQRGEPLHVPRRPGRCLARLRNCRGGSR